jgi:hypothetical protein
VRRLICIAALALAAACEAPVDDSAAPAAEAPVADPNAFRADRPVERTYTGEWAATNENCNNQREVWTIEENRMGMRRQRFCIFERIFTTSSDEGQGWSASARCVAGGRQSHDFVFFRIAPTRQEMRVTINDSESVELVRCPMRT